MFWSKNKKKVYPCKPQFYFIKVGCKGVFVTRTCFRDEKDVTRNKSLNKGDWLKNVAAEKARFGKQGDFITRCIWSENIQPSYVRA